MPAHLSWGQDLIAADSSEMQQVTTGTQMTRKAVAGEEQAAALHHGGVPAQKTVESDAGLKCLSSTEGWWQHLITH
jgi:hypothetical protein